MYHDISPGRVSRGGGPERFAVPDDEFRRQLDQLLADGRRAVTLRAALAAPAPNDVAVTFDDGDAGQYERGFRALADRKMAATFFVTTDWIGTAGFASWEQLREMRSAGMDIQSHTRSHPFLSELGPEALLAELRGAKDALDEHLGQDTDMLALPGGDWPRPALRRCIAESGMRVVATSRWGTNPATGSADSPVAVRRCTVQGVPGADAFGRIVRGDSAAFRQLREDALGALRSTLGASRYSRWRRAVLNALD